MLASALADRVGVVVLLGGIASGTGVIGVALGGRRRLYRRSLFPAVTECGCLVGGVAVTASGTSMLGAARCGTGCGGHSVLVAVSQCLCLAVGIGVSAERTGVRRIFPMILNSLSALGNKKTSDFGSRSSMSDE